jgi:hypothetical protein
LDSICKIYERNRKQKKEKKKEGNKNIKRTRGNVSAQKEKQPVAHLADFPNRYATLASPSLTARAPSVSSTINLQPLLLTGNRRRRDFHPGFNACPFLPRAHAYK